MKCLVSGATGFIGRQLCQQLVAYGHTVVPLSNRGEPLCSGQPTIAVDLARCDPDANLLQGVDVVFHLAGIAHQRAPESEYAALNHTGTLRLARLAAAAGVGCFVFLSSVKAMGAPPSPAIRAESACTPPTDAYGVSKWQAECALREEFAGHSMSVVIVRPALVYGAEVKGNLQSLATGVRWGLPRPPQVGRRSMIALGDLVELLCVIAQSPPAGVHTWIACGAQAYSTQEVYDLLRESQGKGRGIGWLPHRVWQWGAWLLDALARRSRQTTYDKLFGTELYSNAAVIHATAWRPVITLADTMKEVGAARSNAS
ncbi:N-acetyl-alpha-D-glucosaminyl-diphospho-ditrans, octacis-undecaprenol 4-epimerase [Halioglobus japonicus]|nr:N-acetyl-alpha-D-glucosaminyl-diphospho-ditrans, octacis-undecaprenol 4-epimerase [Halioglobus japonicus]